MENFIVIIMSLGLGYGLRKLGVFPANASQVLNRLVLSICLPAVILKELHSASLKGAFVPISMAWIIFFFSFILFIGFQKVFDLDRKTTGTLIMTSGFGNTSFIGFPILTALFGSSALSTGILVDQPGSFLAVLTVGLLTASVYGDRRGQTGNSQILAFQVFRLSPVLALVLALALRGWDYPTWARVVLETFAAPMIPLALLSIGIQWNWNPKLLREQCFPLFLGLTYKLLLAPLLFYGVCHLFQADLDREFKITMIEAATGPMVTAVIIADEQGLDSALANNMVALGIPLSLLTIWIWSKFLQI